MTITEFSTEFDVLYNNIMSNQAPGIDEYEKSVFLTKAQDEILKNYFNPLGNKYREGYDGSRKRHIDFSTLLETAYPELYEGEDIKVFDDREILYSMPNDIFIIVNEQAVQVVKDTNTKIPISIIPLGDEGLIKMNAKPFKQPIKNQGWRLIHSKGDGTYIIGLIVSYGDSIEDYRIRYVRKPKPIILVNLYNEYGEGVSINGETDVTECELDPLIHPEILQRAVELAKSSYIGELRNIQENGLRSE